MTITADSMLAGSYLDTHIGDNDAVDTDPTGFDQFFSLSAGGQSALRQIFLQSDFVVQRH